ncbi:MAG: SRPBCC domain-containing protein [Candidatus Brocadiae bacterium]|nr:SRPBCC domain-containing protein [Candidatus Brocadiia bacterium]
MIRKVLVEENVHCPAQRLWLIMTMPAEVKRWFGAGECSFEPRLGGEVRFRWTTASTKGSVVLWAPPTIFAVQFQPGSRVEFWCDPIEDGTRLVISSTVEMDDPHALSEMLNTWVSCARRIKDRAEGAK